MPTSASVCYFFYNIFPLMFTQREGQFSGIVSDAVYPLVLIQKGGKLMDMFSATNQATYRRRKDMTAKRWAEYQRDKSPVHLAAICRENSFFEHPEVGEEIARLLLADFYKELDQLIEPCR